MLERYPDLPREQKEKIQKELEELGINENIGTSLSSQKSSKNKEKFIKEVEKLQEQLQQEGIVLSKEEIKALSKQQKRKSSTQEISKQKIPKETFEELFELRLRKLGITNEQKNSLLSKNPALLYDKNKIEETIVNIERYRRYIGEKIDTDLLNKIYLINILAIKEWMEENNTTRPPRMQSDNVPKNESKFGNALYNIRHLLIEPYAILKTDNEKKEYKKKHPELDIVMRIVEEIDKNNVKNKEERAHYLNALAIKEWMEKNKTTRPPRSQHYNVPEEEAKLGNALNTIRQNLIKPYTKLKTEQEKEKYKRENPELEEVMRIIDEIDRNNVKSKEDSPYYWKIIEVKEWMEKNGTTKPPRPPYKNKNTGENAVPEEEAKLGRALATIRNQLIKPYTQLLSKEEKERYKKKHPELEEVMEIVQWIDAQKSTQKKVKQTVVEQKNKGELGQNQQIEAEVFEETIRQAEQTQEAETSAR